MATTSTLGLDLLEVGEAQKEVKINGNMNKLDSAIGGLLTKNVAGGSSVALTANEATNTIIVLTGALTANINVTVPDGLKKSWTVRNSTTGGFTITFKTVTGSGVTITQAASALVYSDGTNVKHVISTDAGTPAKFLREDGIFATVTGGGGSGDQSYTDTYANRPGATNDGDLFLPNNGFTLDRADGTNWSAWGPLFPLKRPVLGDFTAVNQGGATIDDTKGGLAVVAPTNTGDNIRIWKKAAPSTPYKIRVALLPCFPSADIFTTGIGFRESSSGKLVLLTFGYSGGTKWEITKWNSPTSFNSAFLQILTHQIGPLVWLEIENDATNHYFRVSSDGQTWIQLYSGSATAFLTANEVLFSLNVSNATYQAASTFLSWQQL